MAPKRKAAALTQDISNTVDSAVPQPAVKAVDVDTAPAPAQASSTENSDDSDVPDGFIQLNGQKSELWSRAALKRVDELGVEADKRNPDLHEMHIYEDFYGYALLDLVEHEIRAFNTKFNKDPKGLETWQTLEAVTFFLANEDRSIVMVDDSERVQAFVEVFVAAWHTLAQKLHTAKPSLLIAERIPNVSNVLLTVCKMVQEWEGPLGPLNSFEITSLLRTMLCRDGLPFAPKKSRILSSEDDDGDETEVDEDGDKVDVIQIWRPAVKRQKTDGGEDKTDDAPKGTLEVIKKKKPKVDMEEKDIKGLAKLTFRKAMNTLHAEGSSYQFTRLWRDYVREHANYKPGFICVGQEYDLTQWPAHELAKFKFDNMDSDG
ncbi:hypothetical protein EXIGLDRAFT_844469 [Exidia glandulosa HHB12029]|uniref:Uncharacterized protein n=1 Tax=Exidia glandulosa HHB12029 TaxID=1314781 RepID=A0A165C158_EXIGL|nr:hypothetical protein EXIGLDRAFT_844469 [Exidia glandulosa HHB12029]